MIEFTEREIRIISAALDRGKENVFSPIVLRQTKVNNAFGIGFIEGALWADEHPKSPWISVEERLPDYGKEVLVLYEYGGKILIQQSCYLGEIDWGFGSSRILAWMPIPSFDEILEANRDVLERIKEKEVNHG